MGASLMGKARHLANLLNADGDVKSDHLDNVPASNDASALSTGTLPAEDYLETLQIQEQKVLRLRQVLQHNEVLHKVKLDLTQIQG